MSAATGSEHDEYTTRRSARREECSDGNDERCVGARGKTARRKRDSRRHGEKLNRRDGSTMVDQYKRDMSRVPTYHQAPGQHAVTTANTMRNLGGMRTWRPRRSMSLTWRSRCTIAGVTALATKTKSAALGMMAETGLFRRAAGTRERLGLGHERSTLRTRTRTS